MHEKWLRGPRKITRWISKRLNSLRTPDTTTIGKQCVLFCVDNCWINVECINAIFTLKTALLREHTFTHFVIYVWSHSILSDCMPNIESVLPQTVASRWKRINYFFSPRWRTTNCVRSPIGIIFCVQQTNGEKNLCKMQKFRRIFFVICTHALFSKWKYCVRFAIF